MNELQQRITVYVPKNDYKRLRLKLIELETSVSEWFRQRIKEII